jgi:hypothetical protein
MRRIILAATGLAALLVSFDAEAKCALPGVRFEPPSGMLPSAPVLRLFLPGYWAPASPTVTAIDAAGKKLNAVMTSESTVDAFATYRVAFAGAAKGPLHVRFVDKQGTAHDSTYTIDPAWKTPAVATPKVTVSSVQSSWTCSHQSTRNLTFPSIAPAYRVMFSPAQFAKTTASIVLPADVKSLWGSTTPTTTADLAIGYVNCMGGTHAWTKREWVRVYALYADGTESDVTSMWLDPP